jgi:hypothetical protein
LTNARDLAPRYAPARLPPQRPIIEATIRSLRARADELALRFAQEIEAEVRDRSEG